MTDGHLRWHNRKLLEQTSVSLTKNGFAVILLEAREETLSFLLQQVAEAATVGLGGSMSIAEIGLITTIIERVPRAIDIHVCLVNESLGY